MEVRDEEDEVALHGAGDDELGGGGSVAFGIGHDGLPQALPGVGINEPAPPPPMTDDVVPCVRGFGGRCRYFMRSVTHFESGNPAGTFEEGKEPRQVHLACTVQPGVYRELTPDSPVLECNHWDPGTHEELVALEHRRATYERHRAKEAMYGRR